MAEAQGIAVGTLVAGRYRVERRLGQGGMGAVYEVEHAVTGQHLALKVLDPKLATDTVALERFRRESRAPARIDSDHVVKVTDADVAPELGGAPFLVMELLRGESFDELLRRRGPLPPAEALGYLKQIARALDRAHGLGIVHRDIKPENLFLTLREDGSPHVKLLDFGIAKLVEGAGGGHSQTATGEVFGTPLYMSPEQTLGKTDQISAQTDVWAIGIIAHKALVGDEPWTAQTLPHLIAQIAYEPLPVPSDRGSDLGPTFDEWFAHCCAREPKDRFKSVGEAVRELGIALGVTDLASSSRHDIVLHDSGKRRELDPAFAATAQASSHSALGSAASDTLTAQVAPGKPTSKVVLAASVGGIALVAGLVVLALRGGPAPAPEAPLSAAASAEGSAVPLVNATPALPEVKPESSAATDAATTAVESAAPAAPRAPVPDPPAAKTPTSKPPTTASVTGTKPTATATTTVAPKPSATTPKTDPPPSDPLSGRH